MTDLRTYLPGDWFAVLGEHASVLLPGSEKSRVARLWEMVDDGAGFDEVLDALIASGLRELPGFVLLGTADGATRAVVRGQATVRLTTDDDEVTLDGTQAATWVERSVPGVTALVVEVGEPGEGGDELSVTDGLVRVSRVRVGETEGEYADHSPQAETAQAEAAWTQEQSGDDLPAPQHVAESSVAEQSVAEQSVDEAPAWPSPDADHAVEPPSGFEPAAPAGAEAPAWGTPPPAPAPAESAPAAAAEAPAFGQPQAPAPGEAPAYEPVEPQQPDTGGWTPAEPAGQDHDGHTNAGIAPPAELGRQHPGLPGDPPPPSHVATAVAKLIFSSGEVVDVDRPVIVGRAPEARQFTVTEQPHLVTVPSPNQEISSTHLEIRPGSGADSGTATVTDLGSTNGSVLVQPGLDPEDLQPGIAVSLLPGAIIDLGDSVTIQVATA